MTSPLDPPSSPADLLPPAENTASEENFDREEEPGAGSGRRWPLYTGLIVLAIVIMIALRWVLTSFFFPTTGTGEKIATLSYLYNKVVRRSTADPAFNKARLDQDLFENDALRTYENSHAEIHFARGDEIRLDENTLVILRGFREGTLGRPGQYYLFVENGSVVLKLGGGEETLHFIETPQNKILFNSKEWQGASEIGISLQSDGNTKITSYSGKGTVEINGRSIDLSQNEYLLSGKDFVADKHRLPPSNVAMQSDEEPIIFGQEIGQDVTFNWVENAGTKNYGIEIAKDADFTKPVIRASTGQTFYTYRVLGAGNYYWRVKSLDPAGPWIVNGKFTFIYDDPRAFENMIVDPQKNAVDELDEKTTIYFQSDYPLVTFSWKPTKRAWGYRLEVFQDPEFEHLVMAQSTQETTFSVKPGLFRDAKYYWQVVAINEAGDPLHVSDIHELNLVYDNAVPFLSVAKPEQNALLDSTKCVVAGVLPTQAQLYVNGKEIAVDERGKFKGEIELPVGSSHVIFKAVGREGRIEYHARSVTVVVKP